MILRDLQQDIVHHGRQSQRIQPLLPQLHGLPDGQCQLQTLSQRPALLRSCG